MPQGGLRPIARICRAGWLIVATAAFWAAPASAKEITVGSAASYGLFTGEGETITVNGGLNITGNVGLAKNYNVSLYGTNAVSGTIYTDGSGGQVGWSNSGTLRQGGTATQSMGQAISDAIGASQSAGAAKATVGLNGQGGAISIGSGGSFTVKALTNLSENVLNITSLSLLNGTLTFDDNGYTGAKFIINVTGNFSVGSSGSGKSTIQGINGATASDILFNIEGVGTTVSLTGNASNQVIGTILAPSSNVTIGGGGTLLGSLIVGANNIGKSYTLTEQSSGFNITDFAYKPPSATKTPEPPSWAIFAFGVVFIGCWKHRLRFRLSRAA